MNREEVLRMINWLELNGFHSTAEAVRKIFLEGK